MDKGINKLSIALAILLVTTVATSTAIIAQTPTPQQSNDKFNKEIYSLSEVLQIFANGTRINLDNSWEPHRLYPVQATLSNPADKVTSATITFYLKISTNGTAYAGQICYVDPQTTPDTPAILLTEQQMDTLRSLELSDS